MSDEPIAAARLALACLDLTSLNDQDDEAAIDALCARAAGPAGAPAWPPGPAIGPPGPPPPPVGEGWGGG